MSLFPAALSMLLAAAPSAGVVEGTITFQEKGLFGAAPVKGSDAVVFLEETGETPPPPPKQRARMSQQSKAFSPRLLVVTVGSEVEFPNQDVVFHNVFSLSQGNQFDLGLYRQGASKAVRFTKPGVVDVFCNIHPDMIGSVLVLPHRRYTAVGEDGRFRLEVPPGKHTLVVYWARGVIERREIEVAPGGKLAHDFTLVAGERARHLNKHGQQYGRYK
jgi:plastocyanin